MVSPLLTQDARETCAPYPHTRYQFVHEFFGQNECDPSLQFSDKLASTCSSVLCDVMHN